MCNIFRLFTVCVGMETAKFITVYKTPHPALYPKHHTMVTYKIETKNIVFAANTHV